MDSNELAVEIQKPERSIQNLEAEIARQVLDIEFQPHDTDSDIPVSLDKATKNPMAEIASLGTAFASVPEAFQTATQSIAPAADNIYQVIFPQGATGALKAAKEGGSHGFAIMQDGSSKLATLVPVDGVQQVATTVPYDPTSLFMAAALMEINKKLDAIQETQQEMFEYIRNKDKAELRGDLETLSDVLNNYRFNWDNAQYKSNKHILVQQIRNDAEKAIIQHRAQIKEEFDGKGPIHIDKDVRDAADAIRDELEEYRLSVYLYSFASFLEVMLLENFDPDYLSATAGKIEERALAYRMLYTKAYDALESQADSSVRAMALGGLSGAMGFLGKAIEKTPVGDFTPIDEALQEASKGIGEFSKGVKRDMMRKITDARSSDVRPFVENIENVNRLYNEPTMLLADDDAIYMLPIEDAGGDNNEGDDDVR